MRPLMQLNRLFSDNMVLQRDVPLPVWGTATPGDVITITFAGQTKSATAAATGNWRVTLDALPAATAPRELVAQSKLQNQTATITGVLVGEVWICSGQSNMQWTVQVSADRDAEVAAAQHPHVRMFNVGNKAITKPQSEVTGNWQVCQPETVDSFSAVGYFFAREIQQRLGGVPVGMINSSWGGTVAEAWTSREGVLAVPELAHLVTDAEWQMNDPQAQAEYKRKVAEWQQSVRQDPGDTGWARGWATLDAPRDGWQPIEVPGHWQARGLDFSGIFWFRREVEIPTAWAGQDLRLDLGPCDKSDITWFNNERVGSITMEQRPDAWCTPRCYTIPARLVKPGRNVIAVRIFSNIYAGGFGGAPKHMFLALGTAKVPLAGEWQYRVEANFGKVNVNPPPAPVGDGSPHLPAALYNGMIAPLVPYALRGAIWYQGESNAGRAHQYATLFPTMIRDWRKHWGSDFPFHFVQLANYMAEKPQPGDSEWAELREAQRLTLCEPNTGMAVAIDIGEANDIHPTNKQDVGRRLAHSVLAQTYGQTIPGSGPTLRDWKVDGPLVRLRFDHAAGGLVTHDGGAVRGFAVAGADRNFFWAWARIEGDTVVLRHPRVPNPVAVRYAWADNPACNLANGAGLPASPFRTDDWPWTTAPAG